MNSYTAGSRRPRLHIYVAAVFLALLGLSFVGFHDNTRKAVTSAWDGQMGKSSSHAVNDTRLHVLIPANNPDVNLCKTLLTSNALGYPDPTILAWQERHDIDYLLGGGSHLAKVSTVLDWLNEPSNGADNDLVVMMDAYGGSLKRVMRGPMHD
ncbi:hypothetical protein E2P81_ATG10445 [Venturia nashicola]|nr:hypothetical protein E2P81_ATG10445 [Venturia nashicola]